MKVINIDWSGTFSLDEVIEEFNAEEDHGIYQIYGNHFHQRILCNINFLLLK